MLKWKTTQYTFPRLHPPFWRLREPLSWLSWETDPGSWIANVLGFLLSSLALIKLAKTNNHANIDIHSSDCMTLDSVQYHHRCDDFFFFLPIFFPFFLHLILGKSKAGSPRIIHIQQSTDCSFSAVLNVCCRNNSGLQIFLTLCS